VPDEPTSNQRIVELERENTALKKENDAQKHRIDDLERLIKDLKRKLRLSARQAGRFSRRKTKKPEEQRKPGRSAGHAGAYRGRPDHVDEEFFSPLGACPCGCRDFDDVEDLEQFVIDIPEVKPHVTRIVTQRGRCRRCHKVVRTTDEHQTSTAGGAAAVSLGARALGLASELKHRLGVGYRKVVDLFTTYFNLPVTHGALTQASRRLARKAEPTYQALVQVVRHSGLVHTDDTGWRVATESAWLWVFATLDVTLYTIVKSRGADVVHDVLGVNFVGRLLSDGLPALDSIEGPRAQCLGHLLRRAAEMEAEQTRGAVRFPRGIKRVLMDAVALAHRHDVLAPRTVANYRRNIERRLDKLLDGRIDHPDNLRFWNHLLTHRDQLLVCLWDPSVPPTNNLAEQRLRGAVITRKIGGCNRSWDHADAHAVLATVAQTAHQNGGRLSNFVGDWLHPQTGPPRSPWDMASFKRLGLPRPPATAVVH
jgi:transposase